MREHGLREVRGEAGRTEDDDFGRIGRLALGQLESQNDAPLDPRVSEFGEGDVGLRVVRFDELA